MKHITLLFVLIGIFAVAGHAQVKDFSGRWVLDISQSKLDERSRVESMTVTIEHKGDSFVRNTERKDAPPPEGMGGRGGRGGMGGGAFAIGLGKQELTLDGKTKESTFETPIGPMPVSTTATRNSDGSLIVTTVRTLRGPMGERKITMTETFTLSSDGATMTLVTEMQGPRPSRSEEVFKKS